MMDSEESGPFAESLVGVLAGHVYRFLEARVLDVSSANDFHEFEQPVVALCSGELAWWLPIA